LSHLPTHPTFNLLSPDYNILQAIQRLLQQVPISTDIFHVKAHQDQTKSWAELNGAAKINVLADEQAAKIYGKAKDHTGLFPTHGFHGHRLHFSRMTSRSPRASRHTFVMPNIHWKCDNTSLGGQRENNCMETLWQSIW
jgi:hypothetical protein